MQTIQNTAMPELRIERYPLTQMHQMHQMHQVHQEHQEQPAPPLRWRCGDHTLAKA